MFITFYSLPIATMETTYTFYKAEQFKNCQATIAYFKNEIRDAVVFYSYTCPQLVKINGAWYQFTFDGSRKAGEITTSRTTSKQKTNYFWSSWRDLPKINLADFEREYFDTRLEKYF